MRTRGERGAVAVLTGIMSVVLLITVGFVVDLGGAREGRRQSQNASDASALAAANALWPTSSCESGGSAPCLADALGAAKAYASKNFGVTSGDWASCTDSARPASYYVISGQTGCISFDSSTDPQQVRVVMPTKALGTAFSGLVGVNSIPVRSHAQAGIAKGAKCALCFMGDVSTNNTDFTVSGGSIAVDGSISAGPNSNWSATAIWVAGTESGGNFTPSWSKIPAFPDPFASLSLPLSTSSYTTKTDPCSSTSSGGPGVYGSLTIPNGTCSMQPGIYVITGAWDMKNNTLLTSSGGVTLYIKSTGSIDFKNGDVNLTAPTTGPTAGFVLLADRDAENDIGLQGNGGTQLTGKTYAAAAGLSFNGNSCFGFSGGPVVVSGASSVGNKSCVNVTNASDATVGHGQISLTQ